MAIAGAWHMAAQRQLLERCLGLRFFRLLGMGGGIGFSPKPDLRTWALLAVWDTEADWMRFRDQGRAMQQYRSRGEEIYTLLLQPLSAHGAWGGLQPFGELPASASGDAGEPVVVLTRATIRLRRQLRFWSATGEVDATLRENPDVLLTFGVGELPWVRQGTLSVWRTAARMKAWAYGTDRHREVIRRTRAEGWYAEELFARFRLLGTEGRWGECDPLAAELPLPIHAG